MSCRARAEGLLNYVYRMEVLHCGAQGRYTSDMVDLQAMGLPEIADPFYEFRIESGDEGQDFACLAWANLDFDAEGDTLWVDQTGVIRLLAED